MPNTSWHCWRHLGQSCFDFIIHVSCSRLGPHVKDTSGFLLNSRLRIALWLACLLANTTHSIYCGATAACTSTPASVCVFFVCVLSYLFVAHPWLHMCVICLCTLLRTRRSSATVRARVGVFTRGTLGSAWTTEQWGFWNHNTLWVSGVKIDCGERLKAKSPFYDFITHNIYISLARCFWLAL